MTDLILPLLLSPGLENFLEKSRVDTRLELEMNESTFLSLFLDRKGGGDDDDTTLLLRKPLSLRRKREDDEGRR